MSRWRLSGFVITLVSVYFLAKIFATPTNRLVAFLLCAIAVALLISAFDKSSNSLKRLLIDNLNRENLANLITLVWFVLIASAYLATALWNLATWVPASGLALPVNITVPASIWVLAGIVTTGLVGDGIIRETKKANYELAAIKAGHPHQLKLQPKDSIADAHASDMITYEEKAVENKIDLVALQHLIFQLAALIVYAVALAQLMYTANPRAAILAFPVIPQGFLSLLGIAQAAVLTNKAIPR